MQIYIIDSKQYFDWNEEKNKWLQAQRGISFEIIVEAISSGEIIDIVKSTNEKYRHQLMYVVNINNYCYLVPHVVEGAKIFLKTIIPSRKHTKKYL